MDLIEEIEDLRLRGDSDGTLLKEPDKGRGLLPGLVAAAEDELALDASKSERVFWNKLLLEAEEAPAGTRSILRRFDRVGRRGRGLSREKDERLLGAKSSLCSLLWAERVNDVGEPVDCRGFGDCWADDGLTGYRILFEGVSGLVDPDSWP